MCIETFSTPKVSTDKEAIFFKPIKKIKMNTNYHQVVELTKEQEIAMYMKLPKIKIIEMLLENQRIVRQLTPVVQYNIELPELTISPKH